jgi:hypothetical protein
VVGKNGKAQVVDKLFPRGYDIELHPKCEVIWRMSEEQEGALIIHERRDEESVVF